MQRKGWVTLSLKEINGWKNLVWLLGRKNSRHLNSFCEKCINQEESHVIWRKLQGYKSFCMRPKSISTNVGSFYA